MSEQLQVSTLGHGVRTLTLNRPEKKNALSIELRDTITAALQAAAADDTVKVVVLTGAGSVFSAGFDLGEFSRLGEPEYANLLWSSSDRFHHACLTFPLPLVAAVNGPALAGGFDLAVMCDIRIAAESARFAHPERLFGDVVYGPLHDIVGGALARDLVLTGRSLEAHEALALGLVREVIADEKLADLAAGLGADIAQAPREALVRTKSKIIRRAEISLVTTLQL